MSTSATVAGSFSTQECASRSCRIFCCRNSILTEKSPYTTKGSKKNNAPKDDNPRNQTPWRLANIVTPASNNPSGRLIYQYTTPTMIYASKAEKFNIEYANSFLVCIFYSLYNQIS